MCYLLRHLSRHHLTRSDGTRRHLTRCHTWRRYHARWRHIWWLAWHVHHAWSLAHGRHSLERDEKFNRYFHQIWNFPVCICSKLVPKFPTSINVVKGQKQLCLQTLVLCVCFQQHNIDWKDNCVANIACTYRHGSRNPSDHGCSCPFLRSCCLRYFGLLLLFFTVTLHIGPFHFSNDVRVLFGVLDAL